jgi:hypothetical protein
MRQWSLADHKKETASDFEWTVLEDFRELPRPIGFFQSESLVDVTFLFDDNGMVMVDIFSVKLADNIDSLAVSFVCEIVGTKYLSDRTQ